MTWSETSATERDASANWTTSRATAPDLESKRLALAAAATEASRLGEEAAATLEQQRALQEQAAEIAGENTHLKTQMQRLSDRIRQLEAADACVLSAIGRSGQTSGSGHWLTIGPRANS